jgi:hypothetical protein
MTPSKRVARMIVLVSMAFCAMIALAWYVGAKDAPAQPHKPAHSLPECTVEDGSSGPLPCQWNGGQNGKGAHYVINSDGSTTYRK